MNRWQGSFAQSRREGERALKRLGARAETEQLGWIRTRGWPHPDRRVVENVRVPK